MKMDSSVAMEGFLDPLFNYLKGYNKSSPDDVKDGKSIISSSWVKEQIDGIKKTFGNAEWVKANYHQPTAELSDKEKSQLSINGKVLKPAEGITYLTDNTLELIRRYNPKIEKYDKDLRVLEENALARVNANEPGDKVAVDMLKAVKSITYPIANGEKTSIFSNNNYYSISGNHLKTNQIPHKSKYILPVLTEDDVLKSGKMLVGFADFYNVATKNFSLPGSDCVNGVWENENFEYESRLGEELFEHFYYQGIPETYLKFLDYPIFNTLNYMREVGRWLQLYTK